MDIALLKRKYEAQRSARSFIEPLWDEIETYILPLTGKSRQQQGATPETKTSINVWDFTAPLACEHLAASLHGSVTPPTVRWFQRVFTDAEAQKDRDARAWLDEGTERIWSALLESDFNMEIASAYLEYVGIGNMVLVVEPAADGLEWKGLDFSGMPAREAYFEEDSRGGVETFFRHLRWTPVQILERFGEEGGVPEKIREKAARPEGGTERLDVVFAISRRREISAKDTPDHPVKPELRPWGSTYFLLDSGERLGEEGGFYEMPAVIGRWGRMPGSSWGYGRGNHAIRAVKYLNAYLEAARAAAEKAVDPPLAGTELGVRSSPDQTPGGFTVVKDKDSLFPLLPPVRFDVANQLIEDTRTEIRRLFREDDLYLKESPAMTATEVQARREMMDRVLGSPLARLQNDVLDPVLKIVQGHLYRAGQFREPPRIVQERKAESKIEYLGQLALSQRMDEVARIERAAAFVAGLNAQGFERVKLAFDEVQAAREAFTRLGVPATLLKSQTEVKQADRAMADAQGRMMQAEAARAEGEAAAQQMEAVSAGAGAGTAMLPPVPALTPAGGVA